MNKEELQSIFKEQVDKSTETVMFMTSKLLEDTDNRRRFNLHVLTTETDKIDELLDNELEGYGFESYVNDIPKFVKL